MAAGTEATRRRRLNRPERAIGKNVATLKANSGLSQAEALPNAVLLAPGKNDWQVGVGRLETGKTA